MPKRKKFTIAEKLECIDRVRDGESQAKVSRDVDVPESTLRGWLSSEDKLRKFVNTIDSEEGLSSKRCKLGSLEDLDRDLWTWFREQRDANRNVNGLHLKEKLL